MIFTYMCKTCGCSFRSRDFGNIERFIEPCILLMLARGSSHGYKLIEDIETHCGEKVDIGDLYRTLRRMEQDEWVTSAWDKNESGPDRRIYTLTKNGKEFLDIAAASLGRTDKLIHRLLDGYNKTFQKSKKTP